MFEENVTNGPGAGTMGTYTFEIFIMLGVAFLLGLWLGWILWNRYKQAADKLRVDLESQVVTLNAVTAELNDLKSKYSAESSGSSEMRAEMDQMAAENRALREQAMKAEEKLLAVQERNRQLETELGLSYQPDTPTPETVPLEIDEKAEETPAEDTSATAEQPEAPVVVTDVTDAAEPEQKAEEQPVTAEPEETPKEEEKPPVVLGGDVKEDLTVVEGIGPKIQELLYQYGIQTYRQLAETDVAKLKEILAAAGPQLAMHDPGTWPSQANLAANDQWEALKSIQGFLKGGKKPT
ncbi:MAG: hypothetical protein H6565_12220 [Lewinellaceae bacterium]|nr:hypothetical protein [Saprospiraceae bacterium]MCB9307352.1 hypothetical protein [Lewinellaceae bacterium]